MYGKINQELFEFIKSSPSSFHTVKSVSEMLRENGYTELLECDKWEIEKGGKYFVTRNLSSVIAFNIPKEDFCGFMLTASHSESPAFKLKPNPEMASDCYVRLNTEKYGGMIMSTWLDRPLSIAGRITVMTDTGIETRLVNIDRDLLTIPSLAIHFGKIEELNPQTDMLPIFGDKDAKDGLMTLIAENAGAAKEDILGTDLFLYNRAEGTVIGNNGEYILSPRLDDLQCVFSTLKGFLEGENKKAAGVYCVFDNEEVGSSTKQGAKSTFLYDVLTRICEGLGMSKSEFLQKLSSSFMLSADNGHAVHPNRPEKSDPVNKPVMNGGILIKYNANQKYTTDGVSEAIFKRILKEAEVPYQEYANKSDMPGGSTLGNLSAEKVSVNSVDIGLCQLAMHSACETAGAKDTEYLIKAVKAFYEKTILAKADGSYVME